MSVGQKIVRLRNSRGWDQKKLIEESSLSSSNVSELEADKRESPGILLIEKIARAFKVSPAYFFNYQPEARDLDVFPERIYRLASDPLFIEYVTIAADTYEVGVPLDAFSKLNKSISEIFARNPL